MFADPFQTSMLIGVLSFIAGYLIAKFGSYLGDRGFMDSEDPRNHRIRALEADVRLAERQMHEQDDEINSMRGNLEGAEQTGVDLESELKKREDEIAQMKQDLKLSCAKTVELRHELTDRAEQTIRGEAALDDIKTELQVARAGSDAVLDEINRLNDEREELTDTVRNLKKLVAQDE